MGMPESQSWSGEVLSRSSRDVTHDAIRRDTLRLTQGKSMHKISRKTDGEVKVHSGLRYPHRLSL